MAVAGEQVTAVAYWETSAGVAVTFASAAAAATAGWSIVFYGPAGTALTSQPTWTLTDGRIATATRARAANVATLTFGTAHGFLTGQQVIISGLGGVSYNGTFTIASTPTATSFTYANVAADEGSTADTAGRVIPPDNAVMISYALPSGVYDARVMPPSGYLSAPASWGGEGEAYDLDALAAAISATTAVPVTDFTTTGDISIIDGNSIAIDFVVLDAALTFLGVASLATVDTIAAQIKLTSIDSQSSATVTGLTCTITSDVTGNRVVRGTLDNWPEALNVPTGERQVSARADLRLTEGTKILTGATVNLTILWQATTPPTP